MAFAQGHATSDNIRTVRTILVLNFVSDLSRYYRASCGAAPSCNALASSVDSAIDTQTCRAAREGLRAPGAHVWHSCNFDCKKTFTVDITANYTRARAWTTALQ